MESYRKLEDKLMDLRLPLPQQRLSMARTLQRAATAVGHHHLSRLTEVACGRIEAEMVPKEERQRKKKSKGHKEERGEERKRSKKRPRRSEQGRNGGEGGDEGEEEHFASGALGPEEREIDDEQGEGAFGFRPEERERIATNASRQVPLTEDHNRKQETQQLPHEGGMRRQFGQPWPDGEFPGQEDHLSRKRASSRHGENHRRSHDSGRPHRENGHHGSHSNPERQTQHGRSRRPRSRERQHKPHRKKHTSQPPRPKKEKLTWKVLLRGFIKGVVAFEMNELRKGQTASQPQHPAPPTHRPSSGRRRRSEPTSRPPKSPSPTPGPSRRRITASSHPEAPTSPPPPSPRLPRSSGRPGLRHASSSDLPPLTPDQIHWREVRAREQGQADIMRAEGEAAARKRDEEIGEQQTQQVGEGEPLAYGEDPFAGPIPTPSIAAIQRNPNVSETVAATGWSFPGDLAASHSPSPVGYPNPPAPPLAQTSKPMPPKWGDPIKERENRRNKRK
ncbi:hypothetical protein BLS_004412 [Venturia inaequalis]|uniref:Uncharacterized protein n=1 Tax=Venturia inaequalis TaxID=5025 RepID=A0A8H3YWF6_VENIN|nr:hypothetical protein BLS_004412 [Venturia inaequalis]KAE9979832.1 hypothetical protein EG327_006878 [Venturia inaequalis]KAE9987316.1 hypothetical protein EG328_003040 [Venturia inaequalis]RDI84560.1 hypothetical protein Vi05172_g5384 [Venturia inaequalis]